MLIDTNQHNTTTIIDGCQVLKEISTDGKAAVDKNAAMQYGSIQKEEVEFPVLCHLVAREFYIMWQHLIFVLCTYVSCIKKIGQSCICWAVRL